MLTFAFPPARRRRRLALAGALFLAFDALLMGVAIAWITRGEQIGLAVALAGAGAGVSCLLAWVLSRPPLATLIDGTLRIEAAHRTFVLDRDALRAARIDELDLAAPAPRGPAQTAAGNVALVHRRCDGLAVRRQRQAGLLRHHPPRARAADRCRRGRGPSLDPDRTGRGATGDRRRHRGLTQPPRASNAATAGRVLPSRNSRKAPPPVEM